MRKEPTTNNLGPKPVVKGGIAKSNQVKHVNIGSEEEPTHVKINLHLFDEDFEITLVKLLKEFKDVFSWSFVDIKQISPKIFEHRIPVVALIYDYIVK